ncbi:MAG: hypothetical protein GX136_04465 [Clostridiales bacterium]|nr:hypothetical protein [Clostridiales bacterium]
MALGIEYMVCAPHRGLRKWGARMYETSPLAQKGSSDLSHCGKQAAVSGGAF